LYCQRAKTSSAPAPGFLLPLPVPPGRWDTISMDFVTGLPKTSRGHDSILVFVDKLSKRSVFVPCTADISAVDTARLYIQYVYRNFGIASTIVSDRDPKFTSGFWQALHELLGTRLAMSTANHPQTDGQTERLNRTLEDMLRCTVNFQQDDWDLLLPHVEFAYNNSVHASTGFTPFFVDIGRHPRTLQDITLRLPVHSVPPTVQDFVDQITDLSDIARDALQHAQERQARYYNQHRRPVTYHVGDQVLIDIPALSSIAERRRGNPKLKFRRDGPYTITEVVNPYAYRVALPPGFLAHDVLNIAALTPYRANDIPDRHQPANPPVITPAGDEEYHVSEILDHDFRFGTPYYKTMYEGQSRFQADWQPRQDFVDVDDNGDHVVLDILLEYEQRYGLDPTKPSTYRKTRSTRHR
jgi:hypothetical protein